MGLNGERGDDAEDSLACVNAAVVRCGGEEGSVGRLDGMGVSENGGGEDVAAAREAPSASWGLIVSEYLDPEGSV